MTAPLRTPDEAHGEVCLECRAVGLQLDCPFLTALRGQAEQGRLRGHEEHHQTICMDCQALTERGKAIGIEACRMTDPKAVLAEGWLLPKGIFMSDDVFPDVNPKSGVRSVIVTREAWERQTGTCRQHGVYGPICVPCAMKEDVAAAVAAAVREEKLRLADELETAWERVKAAIRGGTK